MKGQNRTLKMNTRILPGIIMDPVMAADFNGMKLVFACEECSHFASGEGRCTLGFNHENHLRERQLKSFEDSGRMAQCRFLEID